ncbi:MAG TPA: DNA-processing protein DprA [Solirubrobacteraceae bacterium]|nr:DNA-processing protein DprA [Solirubrobacteraceae bacterium]
MTVDACDGCLRRTALIAAVAGSLDIAWRERTARAAMLAQPDEALLALDSRAAPGYEGFHAARARARIDAAGLHALCRCATAFPATLRELPDPPAVLHVAGRLGAVAHADAAAIVGTRRATAYGLEVARALGRGLTASGVPVVSGMALGIDSAAHAGALEAATSRAPPVAVLAGRADVSYPARLRRLHADLVEAGCVVSEMPPGFTAHRWCFPARNRIIAALAAATVVVEAAPRSGSLITADLATDLGRTVGAVPGQVTSRFSAGTNDLLHAGAAVVRDARDVVGLLFGADAPPACEPDSAAGLDPSLRSLLEAVEQGRGSVAEVARSVEQAEAALRGLSELELQGLVRREFGGRYVRCL